MPSDNRKTINLSDSDGGRNKNIEIDQKGYVRLNNGPEQLRNDDEDDDTSSIDLN